MRAILLLLAVLLPPTSWFQVNLDAARAEPNLEKRSTLALKYAETALHAAEKSYSDGDWAATQKSLAEIRESVGISYESLKQTGKNPRKKPKHFKRAEIATRNLIRKLTAFRDHMAFDDREKLQPVIRYVQRAHDEILKGVLEAGTLEDIE